MAAGRPPKPIEQTRRAGNPGKRRLPAELAAVPAIDPGPLDGSLPEVLARVLTEGASWLSATDAPTLGRCETDSDVRAIFKTADRAAAHARRASLRSICALARLEGEATGIRLRRR